MKVIGEKSSRGIDQRDRSEEKAKKYSKFVSIHRFLWILLYSMHRIQLMLLFPVPCESVLNKHILSTRRYPRSSGYGRRHMFNRSWVRIPALYTGRTWLFFTLISWKNCIVCLKRPKKRLGLTHLFKKTHPKNTSSLLTHIWILLTYINKIKMAFSLSWSRCPKTIFGGNLENWDFPLSQNKKKRQF